MLDFGAGEGHLIRALRDSGLRADGVEPSPAGRIAALSHNGVELFATLADVPGNEYSAAVLLHSLEHVEDPVQSLRELRGVLVPYGSLFIEVPHAMSADMLIPEIAPSDLVLSVAPCIISTPRTLTTIVEQAGFRVISTKVFNTLPVEAALARRHRRRNPRAGSAAQWPALGYQPTGAAQSASRSRSLADWPLARVRSLLPAQVPARRNLLRVRRRFLGSGTTRRGAGPEIKSGEHAVGRRLLTQVFVCPHHVRSAVHPPNETRTRVVPRSGRPALVAGHLLRRTTPVRRGDTDVAVQSRSSADRSSPIPCGRRCRDAVRTGSGSPAFAGACT